MRLTSTCPIFVLGVQRAPELLLPLRLRRCGMSGLCMFLCHTPRIGVQGVIVGRSNGVLLQWGLGIERVGHLSVLLVLDSCAWLELGSIVC